MYSMQLFIKVEEASTQGQPYLNSPKFFQVTTSCEFNLVQVLENILGGDLVYYEIVGPGPWVTWSTLAKELKGQQLTLLYHNKPVAHTRTALYGPVKLNTDLKHPVSTPGVSSRVDVHADETHLKVINFTEKVNLKVPSDLSCSTTDSNDTSSGYSLKTGGSKLESLFVEGNMKTVAYSSFDSQDYIFTLDSQTQVKVPVASKRNLPEYAQTVKIFPDELQCAENSGMKDSHSMKHSDSMNDEQSSLEALNDVPCFSILEQNSSITSSNTQISIPQNDSASHVNQRPAVNIRKPSLQMAENTDLHSGCETKPNNLNNLSCVTLTSHSHCLSVQNSLDSQVVSEITDSKSSVSVTAVRPSRRLSQEENAADNTTEVDDLSKKLSELPDAHLDMFDADFAATSLFTQGQNLQQINVSACSLAVDYVPHTCIQNVHEQQHNLSSITDLLHCQNPGSVGTPPPKKHRPSTTSQQQQLHQQLYHQDLLAQQTQRPNQLQLQQRHTSPQFIASDVNIQQLQLTSRQYITSGVGIQQKLQQTSPQYTSGVGIQQQLQQTSPQYTISGVGIQQQLQQTSPQYTTSGVDIQQQLQQTSPQYTTSGVGIQQQLQQTSPQYTISGVGIQQQLQQTSPQYTTSGVGIQLQLQQISPQFTLSNGMKYQQQTSPQFTPPYFGKQQQTSSQFTSSSFGIQQLQQPETLTQFMVSSTGVHHLQQQQISPQTAASNTGTQQQISPQFTSSSIGKQQLQQISSQFMTSRVDIQQQQQQQQASPQCVVSSTGQQHLQQHQISQHMTASTVDIQQKITSATFAVLNPASQSKIAQQNSVANPGWNLNHNNREKIQPHQQQHSYSKTELPNQSYHVCHESGSSFPNTEEQLYISSDSGCEQKQAQTLCKTPILLNSPEQQSQKYQTVKTVAGSGQYLTVFQPSPTNIRNPGNASSSGSAPCTVSVGHSTSGKLPSFEFTVCLPQPEPKPGLNDPRLFLNPGNPSPNTAGSSSSSISSGSGGRFSQNEINFMPTNERSSQSPSPATHPTLLYKEVQVGHTQVQGTNGSSVSKKQNLNEIVTTDEQGYNVIDNSSDLSKGHLLTGSKWPSPATPKRSGFNLERELLHIESWCPQENGDTIQNTMERYRSQDGSFILWKSRRYNKFIITVSHLNKLLYFRVEETKYENRDRTVYYLFEGGFRSESLLDLLQHYQQNGLRIPMQYPGGVKTYIEHIRLRYPVKPGAKRKDTARSS